VIEQSSLGAALGPSWQRHPSQVSNRHHHPKDL